MKLKKTMMVLALVLVITGMVFAAGKTETVEEVTSKKVSLYANITAIEPILEHYNKTTGSEVSIHASHSPLCIDNLTGGGEKLTADVVRAADPGVLRDQGSASTGQVCRRLPDWAKRMASTSLASVCRSICTIL